MQVSSGLSYSPALPSFIMAIYLSSEDYSYGILQSDRAWEFLTTHSVVSEIHLLCSCFYFFIV